MATEIFGDLICENLPDGKVAIYGYCGDGEKVVVPSEINGKKVDKINRGALYRYDNIKHIEIKNGVRIIEECAFEGCSQLNRIDLPESVKLIGKNAFKDCWKLKELHITSLENWCDIYFGNSESNPLYFTGNLYLNGERIVNLVVPQGITKIRKFVFFGMDVESIELPDSLKKLEFHAFGFCEKFKSIYLPKSITKLNESAFDNCINVESITVEEGNDTYYSKGNCIIERATEKLVLGCKNSSIPIEVKSIGNYAFFGCSGLTEIVIPDGVTSIGNGAFIFCKNLTRVDIPSTVAFIDYDAFNLNSRSSLNVYIDDIASWCNIQFDTSYANPLINDGILHLKGQPVSKLTIPDGVTEIKPFAFFGCINLQSISIPSSVAKIGENAFEYCSKLTSVTFSDGEISIDKEAFADCDLREVDLPSGLKTISDSVFTRCRNLARITIPNSVICIQNYAFAGCEKLKEIHIPVGMTQMQEYAFHMTDNVTIYCDSKSNVEGWEDGWNCGREVVWK